MDRRTPSASPAAALEPPWPASRAGWYMILVVALVRLSAQLDLGILSLLVEPIKHDLSLSDSQMGLLLGFAFALVYAVLGVPLSTFVDTRSRRAILAIGVVCWSVATALTGLAQTFWQLFLCRVGVGAAESVNGPATYSLIADYFPREKLPRAIAAMILGTIAGTGLSLILGSVVIAALSHLPRLVLPGIGEVRQWQLVFVIMGLPGLVFAVLMMTVPEPPRRQSVTAPANGVPNAKLFRYLFDHWRVFLPMFLGLILSAIESGGTAAWRPAFFQRTYGWLPHQAGLATGLAGLIGSPIGLWLGAWAAERLMRKDDAANVRVVQISWIVATPFIVAGPLMPTPMLATGCALLAAMFSMMGAPTQNAALQSVAPSDLRARITALYLLTYTVAGQGIGPSFIAATTDFVLRDEHALRLALAGTAAVVMPLAVLAISWGIRPYGREVARLKALEAGSDGR
ncbi:MAG TPA: MFS transporter [Rhizomicrobium sp.]